MGGHRERAKHSSRDLNQGSGPVTPHLVSLKSALKIIVYAKIGPLNQFWYQKLFSPDQI